MKELIPITLPYADGAREVFLPLADPQDTISLPRGRYTQDQIEGMLRARCERFGRNEQYLVEDPAAPEAGRAPGENQPREIDTVLIGEMVDREDLRGTWRAVGCFLSDDP